MKYYLIIYKITIMEMWNSTTIIWNRKFEWKIFNGYQAVVSRIAWRNCVLFPYTRFNDLRKVWVCFSHIYSGL